MARIRDDDGAAAVDREPARGGQPERARHRGDPVLAKRLHDAQLAIVLIAEEENTHIDPPVVSGLLNRDDVARDARLPVPRRAQAEGTLDWSEGVFYGWASALSIRRASIREIGRGRAQPHLTPPDRAIEQGLFT